jgi:hypothetical protein
MSWLFSQALVEEYLGENFSDGEPSAQAYCAPDKMTAFSRLSRFGMTYKPLTENRGEELLTLYLEDFHARTLVQQEEELESQESGPVCGNTWQGLLAKYDQNTHSWKTAQCSLFEDLELSLETFPKWGMTVGGELYLQPTLVQTTGGTESGLLPTPVASDGTTGAVIGKNDTFYTTSTGMPRKVNQNGIDGSVGLARLVKLLPTPSASDYKNQPTSASWKAKGAVNFKLSNPEIRATWPTPIASRGGAWRADGQVSMVAKNVETYEEFLLLTKGTSKKKRDKYWPTPATRDYKGAVKVGKRISKSGKIQNYGEQLPNAIGGQLNPTWVEWLMGWPLGWTDLKRLEMDKSPFVLQPHGKS